MTLITFVQNMLFFPSTLLDFIGEFFFQTTSVLSVSVQKHTVEFCTHFLLNFVELYSNTLFYRGQCH